MSLMDPNVSNPSRRKRVGIVIANPAVSSATGRWGSGGASLPDDAKAVHARLAGEKELAWIDKGTQSDFYDVPEYVNRRGPRRGLVRGDVVNSAGVASRASCRP